MVCILLWNSAVRVHDSQACRKMDVTRERISRILELKEILSSIQTGFSPVNAAVVYAILESISGLEPSSVISEPRHMKLVIVSSFCQFDPCVDATGVVCHHFGLLGTDLHAVYCGDFVETLNYFVSSSSFPAKPSMSPTKRELVIVLPPMLTVPS